MKKNDVINNRIIGVVKKNKENLTAFLAIFVLSFIFLLKSPLHPWIGADSGVDSSVFKTVSFMMRRGSIPYRDTFDHKGPLTYVINYIGDTISEYRGIWIVELFFLIITLFLMYKTSRLFCNKISSAIVVLLAFSLMFSYFEGGNFTEEYAMIFISAALFIFLDYLKNDKISIARLIICGICCGCTLMIRPNMIATWIVFPVGILIKLCFKKSWNELRKFSLLFITGVVIAILPFIIWLGINNALDDFWDVYIKFNSEYSASDKTDRALFYKKWSAFFHFFNTDICIISVVGLAFFKDKGNKIINRFFGALILVSIVLISISGMKYNHYGMILVPVFVYPLSLIFVEIEGINDKKLARFALFLVSAFMICKYIAPNWMSLVDSIPKVYDEKDKNHKSDQARDIASVIRDNTDKNDSISVYGMWNYIYIISERPHATRYSFICPIADIRKEIYTEYYDQLQNELPKIIVVQKGFFHERMKTFLSDNQYRLIWVEDKENNYDGTCVYYRE